MTDIYWGYFMEYTNLELLKRIEEISLNIKKIKESMRNDFMRDLRNTVLVLRANSSEDNYSPTCTEKLIFDDIYNMILELNDIFKI